MFKNMPFLLAIAIIALIFIDFPVEIIQILYSISVSIKSIIVALLPIIILFLLFKAIVTLSNNAGKIIGLVIVTVCCSNFISTFLSHYIGSLVYKLDFSLITPNESETLVPLWQLHIPTLITNNMAMCFGIISAMITSRLLPKHATAIATRIESYTQKLLNLLTYMMPLFIIGFIAKLEYDKVVTLIIKDYAMIFFIVGCAQLLYIVILYLVLDNFRLKIFIRSFVNMLPAAISGFSTMSSAASLPLTITGTENNTKNKDIARSVIPMTVNIHLIGDCIAIPIFAYAILKSFGMVEPSLYNYFIFVVHFVIMKFSVAAIPGGGIIVMLPILEHYLCFNAEMMSLITALYILFDPVITCSNVLGNGAFAKFIDRLVTPKHQQKT